MNKKHRAKKLIHFAENKFLKNNTENQKILKRTWLQSMYFKFYSEFELKNDVVYDGISVLDELPETGVLFVSNCENPLMDTMLLYRCMMTSSDYSVMNPKVNIGSLIPTGTFDYLSESRALRYFDCAPHPRCAKLETSNYSTLRACVESLEKGWLLTYPSPIGKPTTTSVHPSTAPFIKRLGPIVVPVHISGTKEAFGTSACSIHNEVKKLKVKFKKPLNINPSEHPEVISAQISCAIRDSK